MAISENLLQAGLIVAVVVVLLPLILGWVTLSRRSQMLAHAERMKSLELGHPLPDDPETARIKAKTARLTTSIAAGSPDPEKSPSKQCYETTSYIAGAGFLFAFLVGAPVAYGLAAAAGAVGVTGLICGTILASKEMAPEVRIPRQTKPAFDPEAV